MTDRETTDAAIAAERAAEDSEDVDQNAALKKVQDQLAAAQANDRTDAATIKALQDELDALRPAPSGAAIGASLPLDNLYGNTVGIVRIFLQGDTAISLNGVPEGASVVVSRKTRGNWFGTRLADAKKSRPDITLYGVCSIHEPENDITADYTVDTYKAQCREDVPVIKAAGAIPIQVLMGGTVNNGTVSQYWEPAVEQVWYDVYHGGAGRIPKTYRTPETWLKPYFDAATQAGKPMGFAEFGSRPAEADADNYAAPAYLQWLRDNAAYCRKHPDLIAAAWFNFGRARIRFQNQAMADAWLKP